MTRITTIAAVLASLVVGFTAPASADPAGRTPYGVAKQCLENVTTTWNGETYRLKEGLHFGTHAGSGSPDDVIAAGIWLSAGLREHPSWSGKIEDIEKCLRHIPNLRFTGRTDRPGGR